MMKKFKVIAALCVMLVGVALVQVAWGDLVHYVERDDQSYKWEMVTSSTLPGGGTLYELKLISQVWQGMKWEHMLRIMKPKEMTEAQGIALLRLAGKEEEKEELGEWERVARSTGRPVAVLYDVPNQPLLGGLREDALLAYTLVKFAETKDSSWVLLFPMVKSAVKAMDAVEEFMKGELNITVSGFVVTGISKRGWTTWLTPVVDSRVKGIVPMVYDNLNLAEQLKHQLEVWGKLSESMTAYTEMNIPQLMLSGDPASIQLAGLIDPFAYREQITVPKLLIIGTNDQFWPLDALNLYCDKLVGEKYVVYVPNTGHELGAELGRAANTMIAFLLNAEGRLKLPTIRWETREQDGAVMMSVSYDIAPRTVRVWMATSQSRDFREAEWQAHKMRPTGTEYSCQLGKSAEGYVALFGEAVYYERGTLYTLCSRVSICGSEGGKER